jgi:lysozyme
VSHWDGPCDFAVAVKGGVVAAIAKATQGSASVDQMYPNNSLAIRAAGLLLGAYAFLDGSDPAAQADHLIATVNDPTVPLFLDAEPNPASQATVVIVAQVVSRIRARLGYWPVLYMGRDGPDGSGAGLPNPVLMCCPLWLPEYGDTPTCPPGWMAWKLWQYTDGAAVPGIAGKCDMSRFAGTLDELRAWWAALTSGTAPVPASTTKRGTDKMTFQPPVAPTTMPSTPNPTATDAYLQLVQLFIGLLGLLGVNVPPIFTNLAVEQQVASIVAILAALVWATYSRLVTKPSQIHAAAVASAAAKSPMKLAA